MTEAKTKTFSHFGIDIPLSDEDLGSFEPPALLSGVDVTGSWRKGISITTGGGNMFQMVKWGAPATLLPGETPGAAINRLTSHTQRARGSRDRLNK